MGSSRPVDTQGDRSGDGPPREISMTDLGWNDVEDEADAGNRHAAGTPGGGMASGGLAGTNIGDGDPDNADLDEAFGSGVSDTAGEEAGEAPYAGHAGGAVGGTPAEGRASGGHAHGGLAPGGVHRGDSTIGSDPTPGRGNG